ncbi:MAG TPA: hypothetical protein VFG83_02025 [Kofleriaceae bacterium]|nr:hypothetical protein [Kofleriaceae bacterium]
MESGQTAPTGFLPESGIGTDGPYLVIAPPGNPVISLDSRLLDRIDLIGQSPAGALAVAGLAAAGVVGGALSLIPGGLFVCAGMAYLAHERLSEARRRRRSRDLLLALGDLEVALHVADGPDAAKQIADELSPYTRGAPITRPDVYQDARRRLESESQGRHDAARRELARGLVVGGDLVRVQDGYLEVGRIAYRIEEVREYALRGANLPLPGGRLLQAAMGLLVVAAEQRLHAGEDLEALKARIAAYEAWTGRTAGR